MQIFSRSGARPVGFGPKLVALGLGAFLLGACQEGGMQGAATVDRSAVTSATTSAELMALGAVQLNSAQIQDVFVGHTHDAGDWEFVINEDGTWSAAAKDGSWADRPGTWQIANDQFCREGPDTQPDCQTLFVVGDMLRVAEGGGANLRPWTIML